MGSGGADDGNGVNGEEWVVCLSVWWKRENGAQPAVGWVVHQVRIECVGIGRTDVRKTGFLP